MHQEKQVVVSATTAMEAQRDSYIAEIQQQRFIHERSVAEIQRLKTLCDERNLHNEHLLQSNCELENKKEQERKVLVDQATEILQQKDEQMKNALQLRDEQTRFASAKKDAQISCALVNQDSTLAKSAEGLQCAEKLVQHSRRR